MTDFKGWDHRPYGGGTFPPFIAKPETNGDVGRFAGWATGAIFTVIAASALPLVYAVVWG